MSDFESFCKSQFLSGDTERTSKWSRTNVHKTHQLFRIVVSVRFKFLVEISTFISSSFGRMECFIICILLLASLCETDDIPCELFDQRLRSIKYFVLTELCLCNARKLITLMQSAKNVFYPFRITNFHVDIRHSSWRNGTVLGFMVIHGNKNTGWNGNLGLRLHLKHQLMSHDSIEIIIKRRRWDEFNGAFDKNVWIFWWRNLWINRNQQLKNCISDHFNKKIVLELKSWFTIIFIKKMSVLVRIVEICSIQFLPTVIRTVNKMRSDRRQFQND